MNKIYTKSDNNFEFIKCAEVKKIEDVISYWMHLTNRPAEWDFDLAGNFSKFDKKDIRDGLAKIQTVGGLKAGIEAVRNDKNRISSYFVWVLQASKEWMDTPGNSFDNCIVKFPNFDASDLFNDYKKFIFAENLQEKLSDTKNITKKMKL